MQHIKPLQPFTSYKLASQLRGHKDAIYTLALNRTGTLLVSGGKHTVDQFTCWADVVEGSDGVRLWDIKTEVTIDTPGQDPIHRGPVSCVTWVTRPDELREILCAGTGLGYLIIWVQNQRSGSFVEKTVQRLGNGYEVTCIAKDPSIEGDVRIAVGMRDRLVLLFSMDSRVQLVNMFAVQLDKTVPKCVGFADNDEDILVFGLYDGNVYVYIPHYGIIH